MMVSCDGLPRFLVVSLFTSFQMSLFYFPLHPCDEIHGLFRLDRWMDSLMLIVLKY